MHYNVSYRPMPPDEAGCLVQGVMASTQNLLTGRLRHTSWYSCLACGGAEPLTCASQPLAKAAGSRKKASRECSECFPEDLNPGK